MAIVSARVLSSWAVQSSRRLSPSLQLTGRRADSRLAAPCRADAVRLEGWEGGALRGAWTFPPTGPVTLSNAQLITALGTEKTFEVRAWFQAGQFRSETFDAITIHHV